MNKNASIEKLISVEPHPNADRLDLVKVLGYTCVSEKGLHKAGDIVVYIQPDSILPEGEEWAEGFRKYAPSRIKAVKLRGIYSEGILVKISAVSHLLEQYHSGNFLNYDNFIGTDVSAELGVKHYEPPTPNDLSAKGALPFQIPKTDETRWQNMVESLPIGETVDVTLKVDGQSWSAYYDVETDVFGVLGRTMEYKLECSNNYTAQIERYDIQRKLTEYCKKHNVSICLRGESYGQGIQTHSNNPHGKMNKGLAIFSVYLIRERRYARIGDPFYFTNVCKELDLPTVPIVESNIILTQELIDKYSFGIDKLNGNPFEGVVINHGAYIKTLPIKNIELPDGSIKEVGGEKHYEAGSFKIINKAYDSKK